MSYLSIIEKLEKAALKPKETVLENIMNTGKDVVGCFPIYTPEEIVYAAGMIPVGMWGGPTELKSVDRYFQGFCCSIMRSNMEYGINGTYSMLKGVIIPTFCDTLKCVCENWKVAVPNTPVIPVVYPQNRHVSVAYEYLVKELNRIKEEIENITKCEITEEKLINAWDIYEEYRKTMREFVEEAANHPNIIGVKRRHLIIKAGFFMDKAVYIEEVKTIISGLRKEKNRPFDGIRFVATGLMAEPNRVLDIFDENNFVCVADDLAQETRQFRTPGRKDGNVLEKMAGRIIDQKGDCFLYEAQKTRGQMLIDIIGKKKADAVVVFMMKFCDPEEFDYPIYKSELEEAGIPVLYIELDQQLKSFEQIRTRVQSFSEMLI